ncbi:MAG: hypothetical protein QG661_3083 [Actinomycetota bacterium]|nr:hypothetical protein [Actinomycetota bacterium]
MGFGEAVTSGINNITNFEGRASRPEFWWFVLAVWVIEVVLLGLINAVFDGFFGNLLSFVVWAVGFIAIVSVAVRRLHDVGQTTWLAILWFIPCVFLVPLFYSVQPSSPGANAYGPPPS